MKHNRKRSGRRPRTIKHNEMHGGMLEGLKNKFRTDIHTSAVDKWLKDWCSENDPDGAGANRIAGRELHCS